jgi:NTE family protein
MSATTSDPIRQTNRSPVLVDFALQGGGAHGAFTWGVLDRFLEEPWLQIDGISGTSAGAMNAAVLVDGYAENGAEGARQHLERYGGKSPKQPGSARFGALLWTS